MAVPAYNEFYPAIVTFLKDGKEHKKNEVKDYCISYFNVTDKDVNEVLEISGQSRFDNRMSWGISYLKQAGLIESPKRAVYKLTANGVDAYKAGPEKITNEFLEQCPSFIEFKQRCKTKKDSGSEDANVTSEAQEEITPTEMIEKGVNLLTQDLAGELLERVRNLDPYKFEKLVVGLLVKMGYGRLDYSKTTQHTNDEGIDGLVTGDRFGFDIIYVQAKRWAGNQCVGRPEIQNFCGSMAPHGGTKGIFITTATFSNGAIEYAKSLHQNQKIILIDGKALTDLMIEYNVGVSVTKVYEIKRVDSDYFNEEN